MNNDFTITHRRGQSRIDVHPTSPETGEPDGGWEVTLAETGQNAMTGARVKRIERYIDSDFFLCTYGDGVANINLRSLVEFHHAHGKLATVTGVSPTSHFGTLLTEGDRVLAFAEKPELKESLISGGFFVFKRAIFNYFSDDDRCGLHHEP